MSDRKSIYLPYITGMSSPIPYLFEQIIPRISDRYDILVHSTDGDRFNTESVMEIKMDNSHTIKKAVKFATASMRPIDLIHTGAWGRYHLYAKRLAQIRNRDIGHVHTFRVDIDPDQWNPGVRRATAELADEVTAVSEHTARTAEREFGISPTVIYNGVDVDMFTPDQGPSAVFENMDFEGPIVMFVGYFDPRKRPLDFVEVASRTPEAEFVMAGEGSLFNDAKSRAEHIDNLRLLGRVDKSKLPAMYADASLLLFPTTKEGCPNVVLEAFASGTPVAGYEATSMPELVENEKTGELVSAEDTDALAGAVSKLLDSNLERMSRNAREYAVRNHKFERIAEQYLEVYDSVVG